METPDVLITGSSGMLGRELVVACERGGRSVKAFGTRADLDITDGDRVRRVLTEERPSTVINAAAYNDVDGAESHPDVADAANRAGPENLAAACREIGAALVHFSTDYVFDGHAARPYRVDHATDPVNAYGRSKLAGERAVIESGCPYLLIRTSWIFAPHGRNFVRSMLAALASRAAVDVVDDQRGRPTYAADLAAMTLKLLDRETRGLFHATNDGECTWCELAVASRDLAGASCEVRPCTTAEFPRPAARPAYSVLDISATAALIGAPRRWREALAECVERLGALELSGGRESEP